MYNLIIATYEKVLFEGEVSSLVAPGTMGYLEVLTNHAPILATLKSGLLTITFPDRTKSTWNISHGLLEVLKNKACLLIEECRP